MASPRTFSGSLAGENCHEELVTLSDGEVKALEQIKSYLVKQVHITEQYVQAMNKLNSSSGILKADLDQNSPFVQVSKTSLVNCAL